MTQNDVDEVDLTQPNDSHVQVLELVGRDKQVLDVGCGSGALGAALTAQGCTVVGLERDASSGARARGRLETVLEADLDHVPLEDAVGGRTFDVVVLADVLEHLRDPVTVLRAAVSVLAPGGSVVVSVPNVAHGSVRLALLQGRWDYRDAGLLDRTHIRFYTRRSFVELLDGAGLALTDLRATVLDPLGSEVQVDDAALPGAVVDWVRRQQDGLTYQFVGRAVPSEVRGRVPELVPAVEPPRVEDVHTRRAERESALAQLPEGDEALLTQVVELRRRVLMARDHAIGADAAVGVARRELELARAELEEVRRDHAEAVQEYAAARESATWQAGLLVATPLRLVRKVLGRA